MTPTIVLWGLVPVTTRSRPLRAAALRYENRDRSNQLLGADAKFANSQRDNYQYDCK